MVGRLFGCSIARLNRLGASCHEQGPRGYVAAVRADHAARLESRVAGGVAGDNLPHLEARMRQSGYVEPKELANAELRRLLRDRIRTVDLVAAAEEVRPFLRDPRELELWSEDFFLALCEQVSSTSDRIED